MKKIILLGALLIFLSAGDAQLLYTISNSSSSDGGNTYQVSTIDSAYHDATHCRPAYTASSQFDPVSQQIKKYGYQTLDYYDNGNLKQDVSQVWNAGTGNYINVMRITSTYYQSTSKTVTHLTETWGNGAWRDSTLETNTYDANGYLTDNLNQSRDSLSNTLHKENEAVYYNNNKGMPDSMITKTYQNNIATNSTKSIYTYDPVSSLVLQETSQNFAKNQWQNSSRTTNTYDANKHLITIITETYMNNQWENYSRTTDTYDANGNLSVSIAAYYFDNQWENEARTTYTYNATGKVASVSSDIFSPITQGWSPSDKIIYTYNADGNTTEILFYTYLFSTSIIQTVNKTTFNFLSCSALPVAQGELCPGGNTTLSAGITGPSYQWQVNIGNGFANIANNSNYAGATTATLTLLNMPSVWYGYQYRCVVNNNQNSSSVKIKFTDKWTGAVSNDWSNSSNWSCGKVPDTNTDAIIESGTVVLNLNTTVRSLTVKPGAKLTVNSGVKLTMSH